MRRVCVFQTNHPSLGYHSERSEESPYRSKLRLEEKLLFNGREAHSGQL